MRKGEPLYFLRAGLILPWSHHQRIRAIADYAYAWSSIADAKKTNAYRLVLDPDLVFPSNTDVRLYAFSLRCLLLG